MKYPQLVSWSLPASLQSWLCGELVALGIDAAYTRYILSLLVSTDCCDACDELAPLVSRQRTTTAAILAGSATATTTTTTSGTISASGGGGSAGASVTTNTAAAVVSYTTQHGGKNVRHKHSALGHNHQQGNSGAGDNADWLYWGRLCVCHTCPLAVSGRGSHSNNSNNNKKNYDIDNRKRTAAVECLKSAASEQKMGIENLVDELCIRLKDINAYGSYNNNNSGATTDEQGNKVEAATPGGNQRDIGSRDEVAMEATSPKEQAEKYFAAFPALAKDDAPLKMPAEAVWDARKKLESGAAVSTLLATSTKNPDCVKTVSASNALLETQVNEVSSSSDAVVGNVEPCVMQTKVNGSPICAVVAVSRKEPEVQARSRRQVPFIIPKLPPRVGSTTSSANKLEGGLMRNDKRKANTSGAGTGFATENEATTAAVIDEVMLTELTSKFDARLAAIWGNTGDVTVAATTASSSQAPSRPTGGTNADEQPNSVWSLSCDETRRLQRKELCNIRFPSLAESMMWCARNNPDFVVPPGFGDGTSSSFTDEVVEKDDLDLMWRAQSGSDPPSVSERSYTLWEEVVVVSPPSFEDFASSPNISFERRQDEILGSQQLRQKETTTSSPWLFVSQPCMKNSKLNYNREKSSFVEVVPSPKRQKPRPLLYSSATDLLSEQSPAPITKDENDGEDLLTSPRTHFQPINLDVEEDDVALIPAAGATSGHHGRRSEGHSVLDRSLSSSFEELSTIADLPHTYHRHPHHNQHLGFVDTYQLPAKWLVEHTVANKKMHSSGSDTTRTCAKIWKELDYDVIMSGHNTSASRVTTKEKQLAGGATVPCKWTGENVHSSTVAAASSTATGVAGADSGEMAFGRRRDSIARLWDDAVLPPAPPTKAEMTSSSSTEADHCDFDDDEDDLFRDIETVASRLLSTTSRSPLVGETAPDYLISDQVQTACGFGSGAAAVAAAASDAWSRDDHFEPEGVIASLVNENAIFSSELEEQWKRFGPEFDIQVPRRNQSRGGAAPVVPSSRHQRPCAFFMEGHCRRSDCRFSHDLSRITCRFWEDGECFKGITCPFLHGYCVRAQQEIVDEKDGIEGVDLLPERNCHSSKKDSFTLELETDFPTLEDSAINDTSTTSTLTVPFMTGRRSSSGGCDAIDDVYPMRRSFSGAINNKNSSVSASMHTTTRRRYLSSGATLTPAVAATSPFTSNAATRYSLAGVAKKRKSHQQNKKAKMKMSASN